MSEDSVIVDLEEARRISKQASQLGVLSMAMVILTPCYCMLLAFAALGLGVYALYLSEQVKSFSDDPLVKAHRQTAQMAGALGALFGALYSALVFFYVVMMVVAVAFYVVVLVVYVVIIIAAVLLAVVSGV